MSSLPDVASLVNDYLTKARRLAASAVEMAERLSVMVLRGEKVDFHLFQESLREVTSEFERELGSAALQSFEPASEGVLFEGRRFARLAYTERDRTYFDLCGELVARGALYREVGVRNGTTICPLELRAGLVESKATPRAAVAVAHLAQALPMQEAEALCESLQTLPTSRSSAYRLANELGTRWQERRAEAESSMLHSLEIPEGVRSVAVAVDRVNVPMREPRKLTARELQEAKPPRNPIRVTFRQAYVGCLSLCDGEGTALHTIRYGWMPDDKGRDMLEDALRSDLLYLIAARPGLKVSALGDGAAEIQQSLDRVTEGVHVDYRGVDCWHTIGYVNKAAAAVEASEELKTQLRGTLLHESNGVIRVLMMFLGWAYAYEFDAKPELPVAARPPKEEGDGEHVRLPARPGLRIVAENGRLLDEQAAKTHKIHQMVADDCARLAQDREGLCDATVRNRSDPPEFKKAPSDLTDAIRYLWNHWERMQYADATREGLAIGTGNVEATCKTLVSVRMKRSGARWKHEGAQAILHLRSLAHSSRWKPGTAFLLSTYRCDVELLAS